VIPFFEYFGPSAALAVGDYVGPENIATSAPATDLLFLRRADSCRTVPLEAERAAQLLQASNRTEFTFMNSALISANDYLNDESVIDRSLENEKDIVSRLVSGTRCLLVEGDMPYFRSVAGEVLSVSQNDEK
jgi:hypothetical protein